MGSCSGVKIPRNTNCYLPGEDHKPQSSVQGETPAKKKRRQKLGLGLCGLYPKWQEEKYLSVALTEGLRT